MLSEHIEHTFEKKNKYCGNTENRDNFGHNNREVKFSYRDTPRYNTSHWICWVYV